MSLFERVREWIEDHVSYRTIGLGVIAAVLLSFWLGGQYDQWQDRTSGLAIVDEHAERKEINLEDSSLPAVDAADNQDLILVHVTGAVSKPGVYELPPEGRVQDALQRAVLQEDADVDRLNLAQRVMDGQKIVVPRVGEELPEPIGLTGGADDGSGKISLNSASESELMTLPGVGEVRAKAIIAYREESGGFKSLEDLKNVSGIGDKTFAQIEPLVTL